MPNAWLAQLLVALLSALAGGFVVHRLTLNRESVSARRTQRVEYLVSAYRRLIDAANRSNGMSTDQAQQLESALSDIVLLGDDAEVEAAQEFMVSMAVSGGADLDSVIEALRSSLRRELGLTASPLPRPYNLRITPGPADPELRHRSARPLDK